MNKKKYETHPQSKQNKKRRTALFFAIFGGLAAAGATAALVATLTSSGKSPVETLTLTFNKGDGTKITGTTKIEFKKSTTLNDINVPVVEKEYSISEAIYYYPFVEWRTNPSDASTVVKYSQEITTSLSLYPVFSNSLDEKGIPYHTVTFKEIPTDPTVTLEGMRKVATVEGRTLAMINKPKANTTDPLKTHFLGWAEEGDLDKNILPEDLPITKDLVLVPVFVQAVDITFDATSAGTLIGQDEIQVLDGTKFGDINTPEARPTDTTYIFEGWYKEPELTNKWSADDKITIDLPTRKAYAKYILESEGKYVTANFVQNTEEGQPTVKFTGATKVALAIDSLWSNCTRPNPVANGYVCNEWQISTDAGATWTTLNDTYVITNVSPVSIRPVMTPKIDKLKILGENNIPKGQTREYTAWAIPSTTASTQVEFKLYKSTNFIPTEELDSSIAEVTVEEAGASICNVKVNAIESTTTSFYLRAVSLLDSNVSDYIKINIQEPTAISADYMIFTKLGSATENTWYKLTGIADPSTDKIIASELGDETNYSEEILKSAFDYDVYVSENVTKIPDNFLCNCTNFKSDVKLTNKTITIGDNFMGGCTSFNKTLSLNDVQHIGSEFLYGCKAFNTSLSLYPTTIGAGFMEQCTTFNSSLILGNWITTIGDSFMYNCLKFNKPLSLPNSITKVGDIFMKNCNDFTDVLYVNCNPNIFSNNIQNFSSDQKSANIYKIGFLVNSQTTAYKTSFLSKFPKQEESGEGQVSAYRRTFSSEDVEFSTCKWSYLVEKIEAYENGELTETEFLNSFLMNGAKPTSLDQFVGQEKTLQWAGINHKVRVVSKNFDIYKSGTTNKTSLFTFEFNNVLTAPCTNGKNEPLAIPAVVGNKYNLDTSPLFTCLNGGDSFKGFGQLSVTTGVGVFQNQPAITKFSQTEGDKTFDLASHLKTNTRWISAYNEAESKWYEKEIQCKLYVPLLGNVCKWQTKADQVIAAEHKKQFDSYKNITSFTSSSLYQHKSTGGEAQDWSYNMVTGYDSTAKQFYKQSASTTGTKIGQWVWIASLDTTGTLNDRCVWQNRAPDTNEFYCTAGWSCLTIAPCFSI